jgi:Beta-lactamase enzyme family
MAVPVRALVPLTVLGILLAEVLALPDRRAVAGGPPAVEVVAAVEAAYGQGGLVAVAVARQHRPVSGLSPVAADARSARLTRSAAANAVGERAFPTASMVKLFMAAEILHRARTGGPALSPTDLAQLPEMIRRSDDPAASALWVRHGGGAMVTAVAARYGLTGTSPPSSPGQWGSTTTTARDLARFLALLPTVAHPDDAAALMEWMRAVTPTAADGFDQRFGLFGLHGTAAVKQGWMCCLGGNRHVHSVGVVGDRVVVLLSEVPRSVGYDAARAALTAAAAAVPAPLAP